MDYKAGFCAGEKTTDSAALWQSLPFLGCSFPETCLGISHHDYMYQRMISQPNTFAYSA